MGDYVVIEKDGKQVNCEVLFSFLCEQNERAYVGCTDHSVDEKGRENIYTYSYDPNAEEIKLVPISSPEEFEMVNDVIEQVRNS